VLATSAAEQNQDERKACHGGLTKKAEPPPTCDVNRDSGTASANGGWLRRLVRPLVCHKTNHRFIKNVINTTDTKTTHNPPANLTPNVLGSLMLPL